MPSARPLRLWLALRIALAGIAPLAVVAALVAGVLLPQLRADLEIRYQALARAVAGQIEAHLLGAGRELRAVAEYFRSRGYRPAPFWFDPLDAHAGTGDVFAAIYIVETNDSVYAVGLPQARRGQRDNLLGLDLSKWTVLREARERNEAMWSETFLSAVTGRLAVTLAIPVAGQVLVGEIAIDRLSAFIGRSPAESGVLTMILDRQGQIIAHSQVALSGQQLNFGHLPIVRDALQGRLATRSFELDGEMFVGAPVSIPQLGWIVLVAQPRIEAFRPLLSTLWALAAGALVALSLAILVAWALARSLARRIGRYATQAHAIADGDYDQPWPVSHIREFDRLAGDLERMALAIRQRERDLATSEARYRSVISNAPVVIFQFDEQGVLTLNEGKGLTHVGLVAGATVGHSLFELYHNYPQVCEHARRAISGESQHFTSEISNTVFDVYFNPVRDGDGPIQVLGVAVDITERQRAEEALRQANLVVENSPVMLFRWKAEEGWPVAFVSHNVKQLGYSPEELLRGSTRFASMVHPDDLAQISHEMRKYSESGVDHFQQEYRILAKDGTLRWVDDRTVAEHNAEGRVTHYQGIVIDITERKRAEEELRESEARFRRLAENAPDMIFRMTLPEGRYEYVSPASRQICGYIPEELYQLPQLIAQLIHPDWRAYLAEEWSKLIAGQAPPTYEYQIIHKSGQIKWLHQRNVLIHDDQGHPLTLEGIVSDITERKWAEEALRRGNRQLRMLSDCNQALIRTTDETELLTTVCAIVVQEGGYRMAWVGYAEHDEAKSVQPVAHAGFEEGYLQSVNITWADDERGRGPIGAAIRSGRPCLIQNIASDPRFASWRLEATERGYAAVCALPLTAGDQILGALGIYSSALDAFDADEVALLSELANDLAFGIAVLRTRAERNRAEQALREKTKELDQFFTVTLDLLCIADTDGYFHRLNPQWEVVLGYSLSELEKRRFLDLVHPDDRANTLAVLGELGAQKIVLNFVNRYRCKDGSYRWIEWRSYPLGNLVYAAARDITDRKRAEEELERHREHLEERVTERTAELRQAMRQLVQAEKLAALGHLVAGVAHELNTPLGNARLVASTLSDELRAFAAAVDAGALRRSQVDTFLNRGREAVDLLERNTARAADLIGHFKQVAVDQTSARRRRFDLRQTVEELLITLRPQFKRTAHRIALDIPPGLELDSYPGPLEQVLTNLVGNSLAHGFAGVEAGRIQLRAQALDPTQLVLRYADNGIGIPPAILNRIFAPFFTTRLGQGGSGLGLYIVYNLVTGVLGGTIRVHSQPGQGTVFTLALPRTAPDY